MATIESALRARLQAVGEVASQVIDRIYPVPAPLKAVMPYIVYERLSTERLTNLAGPSGVANPRFRIVVAADAQQAELAHAIAAEVRKALDGYRGIVDGIRIKACSVVDEQAGFDETALIVTDTLTLSIWHSEEA